MITARDALDLSGAQITASDHQAAKEILAELDAHTRKTMSRCLNMQRVNVLMPIDPRRLNPVIVNEVFHELRRGGWSAGLIGFQEVSPVSGQPRITSYQIALTVTDDVWDGAMPKFCPNCDKKCGNTDICDPSAKGVTP